MNMNQDLKKTNEKKTLRKVKKNWVVMAVATFALTGGVSLIGTQSVTAAASDTTQSTTTNSSDDSEVQATGQWGTVNFTFTKDGTLTLNGNGILSMDFPANVNKDAVTKIVFNDSVKLPARSTRLLGDFHNLKEFVGLDKVDASDMEYSDGLFAEDHSIESIDISSWKTPKLNYSLEMFAGDHNVKTINVTGLDTSNVTNMQEMFAHSYNLTNIIGLNGLNVSNVTNFDYFVAWDVSLSSLDISNFKTVNNPSLLNMFFATPSLKNINIAGFSNSESDSTRSFDLQPNGKDDGYPTDIDDGKRQLSSIVTGPNMDLSKMAFQSSVSDMNYYKLVDGQAVLNDPTQSASSNWVAAVIKIVDRDHPDQVLSTLLFQGVPGSSVNVNIPDGYGLDKNSTQTITLGNKTDQDADVKVYKPGTEPDSNSSSSSSDASSSASSSESSAASSATSSSAESSGQSSPAESSASSSENSAASIATSSSSESSSQSSAQSSSAESSASSSQSSSSSTAASSASSSADSSAASNGVIDDHDNNTGKPTTNTNKHHQTGHTTKPTTNPSANVNANHQSELPQTGQRSTKAAEIFGLILIVLSLGLVAFHRHDHHKR